VERHLVVELRSIVEPLALKELFPSPQPLEVELGCGDASFLVELARRHPERNFIGVERLLGRIAKLDRKGRRKIFLRTDDAPYFLQMNEVFATDTRFQKIETPAALAELLTDFEKDFRAKGIGTRRAAYQLNS